MNPNVALIIPARYASTRFPGKALAPLRAGDGTTKSLVQRAWETARRSSARSVTIATDDARIADHARGFGAVVALTSSAARNGSERCAEAAAALEGTPPEVIVNLQGDAPLTPPAAIDALVAALMDAPPDVAMATPVMRCDAAALERLQADRRAGRVGGTTALFAADGRALYFSKEVLPFTPSDWRGAPPEVWLHLGLYAYRPDALRDYAAAAPGRLEAREGLEQLRFIETGKTVLCVECVPAGGPIVEVNNPEDVPIVEAALGFRAGAEVTGE